MAVVIDAIDVVKNKKRLPVEAFFVDTNVIIDYLDPFSRSLEDRKMAKRNETVREVVGLLRNTGVRGFSTITVALEYYKHLQVGFYRAFLPAAKFDPDDFKDRREKDPAFIQAWEGQLGVFKKSITKTFPLQPPTIQVEDLMKSFNGTVADFGDFALSNDVLHRQRERWCIFSNDADFYSFPDDLFLLTTFDKMIKRACDEGKLFAGET